MESEVKEVQGMLTDVVDSVRAIHGDRFAMFVVMMTTIAQVQQRVSGMRCAALDEEQSESKDKFVEICHETIQTLLAALSANIASACEIEDEKTQEGLDWADKIINMAYDKLQHIK